MSKHLDLGLRFGSMLDDIDDVDPSLVFDDDDMAHINILAAEFWPELEDAD